MYAKQLYLGLAIATTAVAAQANAGGNNPLHPSYYWGNAPEVHAVISGAKLYVDNHNPLHPSYGRAGDGTDWRPAVKSTGMGYRDSNNPLHPSFKR